MSLARVYDAFIEAGASRESATAAIEAIEISHLRDEPWKRRIEAEPWKRIDSDIKDLQADMKLLKWMVGANIALTSALGIAFLRFLMMMPG